MTASDVKICSRKKGKASRPSELEDVLLGYYIKLRPRSQESCVYLGIERLRRGKQIKRNFRIKSLLSQNWGHVFTPKFGEKNAGIRRLQKSCPSRNRLMRIDIN